MTRLPLLLVILCLLSVAELAIATYASQIGGNKKSFDPVITSSPTRSPNSLHGGVCNSVDFPITSGPVVPPVGRCLVIGETVRTILKVVYLSDDVVGGPGWIDSDRFDIEAEAQPTSKATRVRMLQVLQHVIEDRFKLKYHHQKNQRRSYALVVANNGPHLEEVALSKRHGIVIGGGRMLGQASMPEIANALATELQTPVVDKTGLSGWFSIAMEWSKDSALFEALRDQLGLELKVDKVAVDSIVIDSIKRPSEK